MMPREDGHLNGYVWVWYVRLYTTSMSPWKRKTRTQDLVKVPILVEIFQIKGFLQFPEYGKFQILDYPEYGKFLLKFVLSPNLEFGS